jgi:hypothetical protein
MSYTSVITLDRAKTYLRIDDTQNETDQEIVSMIESALSYIERKTNVIMYDRNKEYILENGFVKVYDFPIDIVVSPLVFEREKKALHSNFTCDEEEDTLVLNIGYDDPANVPSELISAALQMIKVWYYEAEKQVDMQLIPQSVIDVINIHRRFFL